MSASEISLQINLCAGDLAYAEPMVRALVTTHRSSVVEVVAVADACPPQSTPALHAPSRFPEPEFSARIARLRDLCARLQSVRVIDRVVWLEPDATALRLLNAKYGGVATACSHDHLGHAFSAYFLGWDCARTRYVAHFDADILLWQQPGYSWLHSAVAALEADENILAASPRIAPPLDDRTMVRIEAPGSGWSPTWPLKPTAAGWLSPWFSTRCHLMDRERLTGVLPLVGRRLEGHAAVNRLLSPLFDLGAFTGANRPSLVRSLASRIPPFPLPPEVLLHEQAQARGFSCLYLGDSRTWYVHPDTKPAIFQRLLPRLLESVVQHGECPNSQRGVSGVQFNAWEAFASTHA